MSELRTAVVISLRGDLQDKARQSAKALEDMGRRGQRSLRGFNSEAGSANGLLVTIGRRLAAIAAGGAFLRYLKHMGEFDHTLRSIGSRAGLTGAALEKFTAAIGTRIRSLAAQPQFRIPGEELVAGMDQIISRTGDLKLALDTLPEMAQLIRGGETSGADAGALIASLNQNLEIRADQMQEALDLLGAQGDMGSFEMKDMAGLGPRITAAQAGTGRKGLAGLGEMGALLQMFMRTTGGAEMAATSFERFLDTLTSEKVKLLREAGIALFEPGTDKFRSMPAILRDVLERAGQIAESRNVPLNEVLGQVFDIQAARGVRSVIDKPKDLRKFLEAKEPGILLRKSRDLAVSFKSEQEGLAAQGERLGEHVVAPPVRTAAQLVESAQKEGLTGRTVRLGARLLDEATFDPLDLGAFLLRNISPPAGRTEGLHSALERRRADIEARNAADQYLQGGRAQGAGVAEGRVTVEVRALPGTNARARIAPGSRGLDLDNGPSMIGP